MKNILFEYSSILANTITGIIFGCAFFLLFINVYHYKEVNEVFVNEENKSIIENYNNKFNNIRSNINTFDINNYNGSRDKLSLLTIQNRLNVCLNILDSDEFKKKFEDKEITMSDLYNMQQFYQTKISNECLVKNLYELGIDNSNIKIDNNSGLFIKSNIENLKDSTEYIKKVIKGNSSYYLNSEISKNNIYDKLSDSYYELLEKYNNSIDFIENVSIWYKNMVGGIS